MIILFVLKLTIAAFISIFDGRKFAKHNLAASICFISIIGRLCPCPCCRLASLSSSASGKMAPSLLLFHSWTTSLSLLSSRNGEAGIWPVAALDSEGEKLGGRRSCSSSESGDGDRVRLRLDCDAPLTVRGCWVAWMTPLVASCESFWDSKNAACPPPIKVMFSSFLLLSINLYILIQTFRSGFFFKKSLCAWAGSRSGFCLRDHHGWRDILQHCLWSIDRGISPVPRKSKEYLQGLPGRTSVARMSYAL